MRKILLLGATGSIGKNTLKIIDKYPDKFKLIGATANSNEKQLMHIVEKYGLTSFGLNNKRKLLVNSIKQSDEYDINNELAKFLDYDIMVNALVGSIGYKPTMTAIERNKKIALANKETIVAYGIVINRALKKYKKSAIYPVDSEHSAIWQLLKNFSRKDIKNVIITASGGIPFKNKTDSVSLDDIFNHPVWDMGKKVTIDSSTMMNKGLEIIEASYLFNLHPDLIKVIIHPQSIVHGMVELHDGTIIPHMAHPDMILPIEYALFYPRRIKERNIKSVDFKSLNLEFHKPDLKKYRALSLAYHCLKKGKTYTAVYSAANEVAVKRFINREIEFKDIVKICETAVMKHIAHRTVTAETIAAAEKWAKEFAAQVSLK